MKYKVTVTKTPDGFVLSFYTKIIFWFWTKGLKPVNEKLFWLIDEKINGWKDYYGDKLIIKDCRINFIDYNKMSIEDMAKFLKNKYRFCSNGESRCIHELIDFYNKHK